MDKLLSFMKEEAYKPLTVQELEEMLEITDSDEYKELVKALVTLEEKGLSSEREATATVCPKNESDQREGVGARERLRVCPSRRLLA